MIPDWMIPEPWELEADEERRERIRVRAAAYRKVHRDRINAYHREYARQARESRWINAVGSLHSLSCTGPHRRNRKTCHPIPVYAKREAAA